MEAFDDPPPQVELEEGAEKRNILVALLLFLPDQDEDNDVLCLQLASRGHSLLGKVHIVSD